MAPFQRRRQTTVRSADGTRIAMTTAGDGPTLVLIEPAGHYSRFSAFDGLVPLLRSEFTVVTYDRRGRGASTDAGPYTVQREVEDLAAIIDDVGGSADVHGFSSGALLAIQAAANDVPVRRLTLLEPPLDDDTAAQSAFTAALRDRLERCGNEAALAFFLESIMPPAMIDGMRGGPEWEAMAAIADTLVHDCLLSQATSADTLAAVDVPTLVLDSQASTETLTTTAAKVAGHIRHAEHRSLPGHWHGVDDTVLAAALRTFLHSTDAAAGANDDHETRRLRDSNPRSG
jgi:pimeloyl-ACP methyl ester carboxylesterase